MVYRVDWSFAQHGEKIRDKELMTVHSTQFIQDIAAILAYHRSTGIISYPVTDDIRKFFDAQLLKSIERDHPAGVPRQEVKTVMTGGEPCQKRQQKSADSAGCKDLEKEVAVCRACYLASQRVRPVSGIGGERVRLLVVGDWLNIQDKQIVPANTVFGIEQDRMLLRMLEAMQVPSEEVFITNVIKCAIPEQCKPGAEHIRACLSFLLRQIVILKPQAILAMGMVATKALLDRSQPLSQLRGKLHNFTADDRSSIPLLATFHPTYLLQNPEMKKATWSDLQVLARYLGAVPK
jgi:uracil-DNA glycosylase